MDQPESDCQQKRPTARFRRVLAVNAAAALVAALLVFLFDPSDNLRRVGELLLACFVYSYSIGTVIWLVLTRCGEQIQRRPAVSRWMSLASAIVVSTFVGVVLASVILLALGIVVWRNFWPQVFVSARFAAVIALIFGISIFFYEGLRVRLEQTTLQLRTKELEEERARKLAAEARLSSLESRIHPHFLFNTLNSISALIPEDPAEAERLLERLAALLRFSLDSHAASTVPLAWEMKIVGDYLEIEKARLGDRLHYTVSVPEELSGFEVPPLAVQTLVENSVKHAVAPRPEGGRIGVQARAIDGWLELRVSDDGPGFGAGDLAAGHGLDNLQARLAAVFAGQAQLEILRSDGETAVRVCLPQRRAAVAP